MADRPIPADEPRFVISCSDDGHNGPGYYAYLAEYPDEGSEHFDTKPTVEELEHVFGPEEIA